MARVEIRVSDLSREPIQDEREAARLIVEHPDFPEPIGLDVLPGEITPHLTEENSRFVVLTLEDPENPNPQRYALSIAEFNDLFQTGDSQSALQEALATQQEEQKRTRRRGKSSGGTSRRQATETRQRERVNYATIEHAGEPHRGVVSEGEAEIVRDNLDMVNDRLRRDGYREIDPTDPEMAARYKFPPPVGREDIETEDASPT
jgi:hypothetical protein